MNLILNIFIAIVVIILLITGIYSLYVSQIIQKESASGPQQVFMPLADEKENFNKINTPYNPDISFELKVNNYFYDQFFDLFPFFTLTMNANNNITLKTYSNEIKEFQNFNIKPIKRGDFFTLKIKYIINGFEIYFNDKYLFTQSDSSWTLDKYLKYQYNFKTSLTPNNFEIINITSKYDNTDYINLISLKEDKRYKTGGIFVGGTGSYVDSSFNYNNSLYYIILGNDQNSPYLLKVVSGVKTWYTMNNKYAYNDICNLRKFKVKDFNDLTPNLDNCYQVYVT